MVSYKQSLVKESDNLVDVLILVVVEDGLVQSSQQLYQLLLWYVLILVVVEDGLVLDLTRHY